MKKLLAYIASVVVSTGVLSLGVLGFIGAPVAQAATQTANVYPNSDDSPGAWTQSSGGSDYWGRIHRPTASAASSSWVCSKTGSATTVYGAGAAVNPAGTPLPMPDVQQGVTAISAQLAGRTAYIFGGGNVNMSLQVLIGGNSIGTGTGTWNNGPFFGSDSCTGSFNSGYDTVTMATVNAPAGSEWTQQQINTMQFQVSRSGNARATRLMALNGQLTYITYSTLNQSGYRFYQNANSTTPGAALGAAANTAVAYNRDTLGGAFRLRAAVATTNERWLRQYGTYKLQFTTKTAATCAASTGWADVQAGSGDIRWNTNPGAANGAAITNIAGQPGGTMVPQRYQSANPFSKQVEVPNNQSGIWDFSLQHAGSNYGAYCFRIVNNDGNTQALNGYTNYPEISIEGGLSVDIVSATGISIGSPKITFSSLYALDVCQQSTGVLGTAAERIRVTDNRSSGNWSLSVAATGGGAARWTSGANSYAFNNPAGSPAGCANGQLSLNFSTLGATTKPGCTGTGLWGSTGTYAFAASTPIGIGGASGADRFCYWDITGVGLEQQIPGATPPGSYTIDMTLTVTAT